jgi:hypothetical protein
MPSCSVQTIELALPKSGPETEKQQLKVLGNKWVRDVSAAPRQQNYKGNVGLSG